MYWIALIISIIIAIVGVWYISNGNIQEKDISQVPPLTKQHVYKIIMYTIAGLAIVLSLLMIAFWLRYFFEFLMFTTSNGDAPTPQSLMITLYITFGAFSAGGIYACAEKIISRKLD